MGLVSLTIGNGETIRYFSLSEEIQAIASKFFDFITNITPGWIVFIFAISLAFVIVGVIYRLRNEVEQA